MIASFVFFGVVAPAFVPQATWKTYAPASLRMSILLPGKPMERKVRLTESVDKVATMNWYTLQIDEFTATLNYSTYKKGVAPSAKGAAEGSLAGLKQAKPNAKFSSIIKPATLSGLKGYKVYATFLEPDGKAVFESVVLSRGQGLWQLIFTYSATPTNGAMAKKALASVKIRP